MNIDENIKIGGFILNSVECDCFVDLDVCFYNGDLDFLPITLESKNIIESYTKPWEAECSDLSFANLFIWGTDKKMEYAIKNDFLFIKLDFVRVPVYFWAPIPKFGTKYDYRTALLTAVKYMENKGVEPTFRSVCNPFDAMMKKACPNFYSMPTDIAWDYIYERESLATLKGKKLHGKRNHINKFLSTYNNYEYKTLDNSMIDDCIKLYDLWIEEKDDEIDEGLLEERRSVVLALNNMETLKLVGGCIYVDNKLVAFTVGEKITKNMQLIHIEKADYTYEGIFPMINQQYIINECIDVDWINREEDMGLEGMRRAKRSYNPARMIEKYIFSIRDLSKVENLWGDEKNN